MRARSLGRGASVATDASTGDVVCSVSSQARHGLEKTASCTPSRVNASSERAAVASMHRAKALQHLVFVFGDEFKFGFKCVVEIIDVIKVLAAISVTLAHLFDANQVVDQFAEVAC